jgi:glucans biosynthesis protein C
MPRRHDIDALRALAFGLLILYHLGMLYVPDWGWHLKSSYLQPWLDAPMLLVNRWRMDLIFLISGVSTAYMMVPTTAGAFLRQRSRRLLLPLLFGVLVIVPLQPYCQGVANGLVEPGFGIFLIHYFTGHPWPEKAFDGWQYGFTWNHLWYLVYLFFYTVVLVALQPMLRSRIGLALRTAFVGLRSTRLLCWPAAPIFVFTATLQLAFPQNNALIHDWYAHSMYFTMFLYGWWLAEAEGLWQELSRLRAKSLLLALLVYVFYTWARKSAPDDGSAYIQIFVWALRNLYVWAALCAILGCAHCYLNRPFRWLPWATASVFPWYILHQSAIVLLAYWLVPLKLGATVEGILMVCGTVLACWLLTSGLIARVDWLRPLFGMRARLTKEQWPQTPPQ